MSIVGIVFHDCKALCSAIDQYSISFVRRSGNVVAHSIVRVANSLSGRRVFKHVCPSFIYDVITNDLIE